MIENIRRKEEFRKEVLELMIEKGICYMRAGEIDGSLQVTPDFERMRYVLLHRDGKDAQLFHIKNGKEGSFSIWTKETLENMAFIRNMQPIILLFRLITSP